MTTKIHFLIQNVVSDRCHWNISCLDGNNVDNRVSGLDSSVN